MPLIHRLRLVGLCTLARAATIDGASIVTRKQLTLESADMMASAAIAEAKSKNFNDISVSVLDATGRELVAKTQIGCPRLIPAMARAKAGAAIGTHSSSRALKDKYLPEREYQLQAMTTIGNGNSMPFVAVPGGVICKDDEGDIIGAIGVSGASADEDEACAVAGAEMAGFKAQV